MSQCTRKSLTAQAVQEAMEQHDGLVHAFIRRQGGGDIPYEDALQAGRIGLWRALLKYDPARGTKFSTYAWVAICRHVCRAAVRLAQESPDCANDGSLPSQQHMLDPEDWVEQRLVKEALIDLVGQLPARLQQVIVARYGLEEQPPCTLRELGEQLGLSGERVRQLQQDALAWLRHPAHSCLLRQLVGKNTAADYRRALAQNAAMRRSRRQKR